MDQLGYLQIIELAKSKLYDEIFVIDTGPNGYHVNEEEEDITPEQLDEIKAKITTGAKTANPAVDVKFALLQTMEFFINAQIQTIEKKSDIYIVCPDLAYRNNDLLKDLEDIFINFKDSTVYLASRFKDPERENLKTILNQRKIKGWNLEEAQQAPYELKFSETNEQEATVNIDSMYFHYFIMNNLPQHIFQKRGEKNFLMCIEPASRATKLSSTCKRRHGLSITEP